MCFDNHTIFQNICNLVGGIPTPLKNMKVSWDYYSKYMEKCSKCSKPPTSNHTIFQNINQTMQQPYHPHHRISPSKNRTAPTTNIQISLWPNDTNSLSLKWLSSYGYFIFGDDSPYLNHHSSDVTTGSVIIQFIPIFITLSLKTLLSWFLPYLMIFPFYQ